MYKKYSVFISKKIKEYHLVFDYEDVFQESIILLNKAIDRYVESEIPFYSYFMKMLSNKLSTMYFRQSRKRFKTVTIDNENTLMERGNVQSDLIYSSKNMFKGLTQQEKTIANLFYIAQWSVDKIGDEFGYTKARVYYMLKLIKAKILDNYNNI